MKYKLFFYEREADHSFCLRVYLPWRYSITSLAWFEELLDPIKKPILKIPFLRNSKSSVWNTNFFPRQAIKLYQKLFLFEIRTFFLRKLGGPFFLSRNLPTLRLLHTKFGLLWTASWPDKKDLFLKFLFWKNRKFPYEKLIFFRRQAIQKKFFLLFTFITLVILHTKFVSLWTTRPDKSSIFLKLEKAKKSIFPKFILKYKLFFYERKADHSFCLRIYLPWGYSIPSLVWFEELLDPIKTPILKIPFLRNSKNSVWNTNFFLAKLYQKLLWFQILITLMILHAEFGLIWTTPWPDKVSIFLKIE